MPVDLPSEAEWECAARAGRYGTPANSNTILSNEGWTGSETEEVMEVGTRQPNAWDMYDMLGNCCEFVLDFYGTTLLTPYFASADARVDPHGPVRDDTNLIMLVGGGVGKTRGDYYSSMWSYKKSNYQYYNDTDTGFRLWAPGVVSWK